MLTLLSCRPIAIRLQQVIRELVLTSSVERDREVLRRFTA